MFIQIPTKGKADTRTVVRDNTKKESKAEQPSNKWTTMRPSEEEADLIRHFEEQYYKVNGEMKIYNMDNTLSTIRNLITKGYTIERLKKMIDFVLLTDQDRIDKIKFAFGTFEYPSWEQYINRGVEQGGNRAPRKSNVNRRREWSGEKSGIQFSVPQYS